MMFLAAPLNALETKRNITERYDLKYKKYNLKFQKVFPAFLVSKPSLPKKDMNENMSNYGIFVNLSIKLYIIIAQEKYN